MGVLNVTRCLGWLPGLMEAGPHPPQRWEDGGLSPVNTGANGKYFGSLELSQAGTLGERGCPRNEALSCLSAMLKFVQIILCVQRRRAGRGQGLVRGEGKLCPRRFVCSRGREYVVQSHTPLEVVFSHQQNGPRLGACRIAASQAPLQTCGIRTFRGFVSTSKVSESLLWSRCSSWIA